VLPCAVNDIGLIGEATIIGALQSGELAVWDINANTVSNLPAHSSPCLKILVTHKMVISGDETGVV